MRSREDEPWQHDESHLQLLTLEEEPSSPGSDPEEALFSSDHCSDMPLADDSLLTLDGSLLPASFRAQSVQITADVIRHVCAGDREAEPASSKSATIMRSLVDDLLRTRLSSMRELADKLDVQCPDDVGLLNSVATAMFDDDVVTWGRIVTLFAFAAYLARHCRERDLIECSETVIRVLDTIIVDRLGLWILASGGWVSDIVDRVELWN